VFWSFVSSFCFFFLPSVAPAGKYSVCLLKVFQACLELAAGGLAGGDEN
jgi:hypothetical protein